MLVDYTRHQLVRVLQVSHPAEAWALDFHPQLAIMATGSARGDVRFWNVADRKPAVGKVLKTEWSVWALTFLPTDGSLMALGHDKGMVEVLRFPSLQPCFRERLSHAAERVSALRFSDSGTWLAAGCWDQEVYLLKLTTASSGNTEVRLHRVLSGNSSSPTAVMFSADSQYVMSNSKDCQILYWNTKDGAPQKHMSIFRDTRWQKPWTSVLGWHVIGIWGDPNYDGSDINSACQSNEPMDDLLAFGDDYGCVKLIRFPSPFVDPGVKVYSGHASHVTAVRFSRSN
ncbi:EML3, partial [Symbiodinium pilosum]